MRQLVRYPVKLIGASVLQPLTSQYGVLHHLYETQANGIVYTEPVVSSGQLIGIVSTLHTGKLAVIPATTLKNYLEDIAVLPYRGFPSLGIRYQSLVSSDLRHALGVTKEIGVRVVEVARRHSGANSLAEDDIITHIGQVAIDRQGYYRDPIWGDLPLGGLLNLYKPGDRLDVRVLRLGKPVKLRVLLIRHDSNRPIISYQR